MNAKKLSAVLAAILLPTLAAASDIKPGAIQLSGRSNLDLSSGEKKITTTAQPVEKHDLSKVGFEAGALYFVTGNVGVGLEVGYDRTKDKLAPITTTDSLLTIGPRVGVDFGIAEKLSVFGDADLVYASGSHKETDSTDPMATIQYDVSGFGFGLAAGLKYFPIPALSIDVGVDYRYLKVKGDVTPLVSVTTKTSGIGGFAGLSFYFGN